MFQTESDPKGRKAIRLCKMVGGWTGIALILFCGMAPAGWAGYPERGIEVVVPFAPGGATDLHVRMFTEALTKKWKKPVSVVNKPGGNCVIGVNYVMRATPDGYTILGDGGGSSSLQVTLKNLPYRIEDRTFIGRVLSASGVFVVPSNSPWKTLSDVADSAKKDPANFIWSSLGGSSQADLQMMQFFAAAKIDISKSKKVVFSGAGAAVNAAAGGHVQFASAGTVSALPLTSSGLIRCLAITSSKRDKGLPNVPTTAEQGFPTVDTAYWMGFSGPPRLPEEVTKTWIQTLKDLLSDPSVISHLEEANCTPGLLEPGPYRQVVDRETQMVRQLLGGK